MHEQENFDDPRPDTDVVYDGLSIRYQPASIVKRIVAYCVDAAIVTSSLYILIPILAVGLGGAAVAFKSLENAIGNEAATGLSVAVIVAMFFCLILVVAIYDIYFVYFEHKKGCTPGKAIFGLKVVSLDGTRLTIGQCVTRDLLRLIDCFMLFPGLLSIALTEKRRRLGDLMAGTMVVHSEEREEEQDFCYITQADYQFLRDALKPKDPTPAQRREFLIFANECFMLARKRFHPGVHAAHVQQAVDSCTNFNMKLDPKTIVLFYAEHCFQLQRNQRKEK